MLRLFRVVLFVMAAILLIAGAVLPWASWNNLFGRDIGGEWSVTNGHDADPRIVLSGLKDTGGFKIRIINYDKDGRESDRLTVESPHASGNAFLLSLVLGVLACIAAFLRFKWVVSILAVAVAWGGVYPWYSLQSFFADAAKLNKEIPLEPSSGVGISLMLVAAVLALVSGVIVWLEPGRTR